MYKKDYLMALGEHAFSWTFMVMLIPSIYILVNHVSEMDGIYFVAFCVNWATHFLVDDFKANQRMINLVQDQLIHIGQVIATWSFFILS